MRLPVPPLAVVVLLAGAACTSRRSADVVAPPAPPEPRVTFADARPLAMMATQPVVVVPVQRLRADAGTGWERAALPVSSLLRALDEEIALAVRARGTASAWRLAPDVSRMVRRSPTLGVDAHGLPVDALLERDVPADLPPALVQPLRAMAGIGGQRYVLVPAELRIVRRDDGRGEAVLRVALVDTRGGRQLWAGDVRSDPADSFGRGLFPSLAEHFADLIAAPAADGA